MNILLVDDHPGKLLAYEAMLAELGENLIAAQSGMQALECMLKTDVALVLMDVNMPGMDGFETAQMIHEHPRFHNTPIIFVSGVHVTDMDRLKGYEYGAVDYVPVPVIPQLLRAKVRVFTELHRKTHQLEMLNARMSVLQDEERRRIARELHDSVGQLLAAVRINNSLVGLENSKLSPKAAQCLAQNTEMVDQVSQEIRTISHLLHPPLLDEAGLASALRWFVDGFAERSKIQARLDIAEDFTRLPNEVELSIFRVVQECLTNIHRHSGSPTAAVRVALEGATVRVEIQDAGKGMALDKESAFISSARSGVGLRGMRERLRLLGGTLHLHSDENGTKVAAVIPISHSDSIVLSQKTQTQNSPETPASLA
ncbi:MAG TPA: response regulator [Candidatus Sulfotelmatobacter sp.]|nr:response regulator [Candidatus Sulfotelmatobacter sp.]